MNISNDRRQSARRSLRRTRRSERGFNMIEVVIALSVLSVGVLGTSAAIVTSLRHSSQSRNMTQALYLAEQQIEAFRAMTGPDVLLLEGLDDPANPIKMNGNEHEVEFERRWTISPDVPEVGLMTLTVEVDWPDARGNVRTISLQTLKVSG